MAAYTPLNWVSRQWVGKLLYGGYRLFTRQKKSASLAIDRLRGKNGEGTSGLNSNFWEGRHLLPHPHRPCLHGAEVENELALLLPLQHAIHHFGDCIHDAVNKSGRLWVGGCENRMNLPLCRLVVDVIAALITKLTCRCELEKEARAMN
jgi:hypothetical protein